MIGTRRRYTASAKDAMLSCDYDRDCVLGDEAVIHDEYRMYGYLEESLNRFGDGESGAGVKVLSSMFRVQTCKINGKVFCNMKLEACGKRFTIEDISPDENGYTMLGLKFCCEC